MKNNHPEITIIILATTVVLLLVLVTVVVIELERKMLEKPVEPSNEETITISTNLETGFYYNTSDIENQTNLKFNSDGSFIFNYNTCNGSNHLKGTYQVDDSYVFLTILDNTDIEKEILLVRLNNEILEYRGPSLGCSPFSYSVFILK